MHYQYSKTRKASFLMKRFIDLLLVTLLISVMPKIAAAQQCAFPSLESLGFNPIYANTIPVLESGGVNDICDASKAVSGAPAYNVQSLQVSCPTLSDPSITFTFTFNFGTATPSPLNSILTSSTRLVGFIYLDTDLADDTGLPLGHSNNYIPSPTFMAGFQGNYIARLGADYCIDLTTTPIADPNSNGGFLYPILKLNHNSANNSSCHGDTTHTGIKAKVNFVDAVNLAVKIENILQLDSRNTGGVDFTAVFGYATTFGASPDPTNPNTFAPTEIAPDQQNRDGRVGRNCDVGFIDASGGGSPFGKKAITLASRSANEQGSDRLVFLNLINGIPYRSYTVDLISTPNVFAAIDLSRGAVTERAFGFRMDLKLKRGDTLSVVLTPEGADSRTVIARGSGPVGIIFFDPVALDKLLNTIGDQKISIQGSNARVTPLDTLPRGFFAGWSAFNKLAAIDLKGKNTLQSPDDIRIIPNPLKIGAPPRIVFANLPARVTIRIYTERGDLLTTIEHANGTDSEEWNLFAGFEKVCRGVYIAHFQPAQGKGVVRKFLIL